MLKDRDPQFKYTKKVNIVKAKAESQVKQKLQQEPQ